MGQKRDTAGRFQSGHEADAYLVALVKRRTLLIMAMQVLCTAALVIAQAGPAVHHP